MKIYVYFGLCVLLFCLTVSSLTLLGKRRNHPFLRALSPLVGGQLAAVVYARLCVRLMIDAQDEITITALHLVLLLLSCLVFLGELYLTHRRGEPLSEKLLLRCIAAFALLAFYAGATTWAMLSAAFSESYTSAIKAGIFFVIHLTNLFPVGVALLAFLPVSRAAQGRAQPEQHERGAHDGV